MASTSYAVVRELVITAAAFSLALIVAPSQLGDSSLYWLATFPFGAILIVLSVYDRSLFILPDKITLPFALCGLLVAYALHSDDFLLHLLGAAAGYVGLGAVALAYEQCRGYSGLGFGDVKLFGALGAWLGIQALGPVLLLACGIGLFASALAIASGHNMTMRTRIPFGSCLSLAAWMVWLFGPLLPRLGS